MRSSSSGRALRVSRSLLLGVLVLGLFAGLDRGGASAAARPRVGAVRMVSASYQYAGTSDPEQALTATFSTGGHNAPWVVVIHGGSWEEGSRADMIPTVNLLAGRGLQVFNLAYRLAGASYAQQVSDVTSAARWIVAHATQFGIDPRRGAVYGFSAGGQLAAVLGLTGSFRAIVTASGVLQPQRVAAVAQGLDSAEPIGAHMPSLYAREQQMMGCAYSATGMSPACALAWYQFEPEHLIRPTSPPMMIFQGGADSYVPPSTATAFGYWLGRAHVRHTVVIVPGLGHADAQFFSNPTRLRQLLNFLTTSTR
jgi:acetyl esterase/lipase